MKAGLSFNTVVLCAMLFTLHLHAQAFTSNRSGIVSRNVTNPLASQSALNDENKPLPAFATVSGNVLSTGTITLTIVNFESRIAELSWINSSPGEPGTYYIERQTGASGWVLIGTALSTDPSVYNDTITAPYCSPTQFTYRVRFVSDTGLDDATSGSIPIILADYTHPEDVPDVNVSLMQTSIGFYPRLTWNRITNDAISGYIIQLYNGFNWDSITTVSPDSAAYTHPIPNACNTTVPFKYVVRSIDQCNNQSDGKLYPDILVQTLLLDVQEPNDCNSFVNLSWNAYPSIPGGIGNYQVYRSDGANTVIYDAGTNTNFRDTLNLVTGVTYTYSVKENNTNGMYSASSCEVIHAYNTVNQPDVYVSNASVVQDQFIRVSYQVTLPNPVIKLILERSDNGVINFIPIDSLVAATGTIAPDFYIDDTTADVHSKSYFYRMVAFNKCNERAVSRNLARSIWLQCKTGNAQNSVNWNGYEDWLHGVEFYSLYRTQNGLPLNGAVIGLLQPTTLSFDDPDSGLEPFKQACYWVEGNEALTSTISKSNKCCIMEEPSIFMPNAFNPGSNYNFALRPVMDTIFSDPASFRLTVFDRWGQQIFETTNMTTGWNGVINGQNAPSGLYIYLLTYKSKLGTAFTKRGTATLIR